MYLANQVVEIIDFFIIFLNYIISTWLGGSKRHTTHLGIVGSINNLDINIDNEINMNYDDDDDVCEMCPRLVCSLAEAELTKFRLAFHLKPYEGDDHDDDGDDGDNDEDDDHDVSYC